METRAAGAAVGPRLAGRLTAELILRSPQYMSCAKDYELEMRGHKISTIENLGATENQFDSIDLSDNIIVRLEGFPKLHRLKMLLLNNNRIVRIARRLEETVPNLQWLILTNNRMANLQDLDPLASLPVLTHLSLVGNPVALKPDYRLYVIYRCKKLRQLDFKKVKQVERDAANARYKPVEGAEGAAAKPATFEPDEELQRAEQQAQQQQQQEQQDAAEQEARLSKGPTPEQIIAIKAAIANAATLEEVARLEAALTSGNVPSALGTEANANGQQDVPQPMDEG